MPGKNASPVGRQLSATILLALSILLSHLRDESNKEP